MPFSDFVGVYHILHLSCLFWPSLTSSYRSRAQLCLSECPAVTTYLFQCEWTRSTNFHPLVFPQVILVVLKAVTETCNFHPVGFPLWNESRSITALESPIIIAVMYYEQFNIKISNRPISRSRLSEEGITNASPLNL